jgi:hypothetical protein
VDTRGGGEAKKISGDLVKGEHKKGVRLARDRYIKKKVEEWADQYHSMESMSLEEYKKVHDSADGFEGKYTFDEYKKYIDADATEQDWQEYSDEFDAKFEAERSKETETMKVLLEIRDKYGEAGLVSPYVLRSHGLDDVADDIEASRRNRKRAKITALLGIGTLVAIKLASMVPDIVDGENITFDQGDGLNFDLGDLGHDLGDQNLGWDDDSSGEGEPDATGYLDTDGDGMVEITDVNGDGFVDSSDINYDLVEEGQVVEINDHEYHIYCGDDYDPDKDIILTDMSDADFGNGLEGETAQDKYDTLLSGLGDSVFGAGNFMWNAHWDGLPSDVHDTESAADWLSGLSSQEYKTVINDFGNYIHDNYDPVLEQLGSYSSQGVYYDENGKPYEESAPHIADKSGDSILVLQHKVTGENLLNNENADQTFGTDRGQRGIRDLCTDPGTPQFAEDDPSSPHIPWTPPVEQETPPPEEPTPDEPEPETPDEPDEPENPEEPENPDEPDEPEEPEEPDEPEEPVEPDEPDKPEYDDKKDYDGGVDTAPGIIPDNNMYDPEKDDTPNPSESGNGTESPNIDPINNPDQRVSDSPEADAAQDAANEQADRMDEAMNEPGAVDRAVEEVQDLIDPVTGRPRNS